jgi:mono/diheme cytochrome c family protein
MCKAMMMFALVAVALVPVRAQTGAASLTLTTTPNPIGLGQNRFDVTVTDAKGQPVTDAEISLSLVMPPDPKTKHPEMRTDGKLNNAGGGKYNGVAMVTMAGTWQVMVTATQRGKPIGQTKAAVTVRATKSGAGQTQAKPAASQHGGHAHTHAAAAALKNPVPPTTESTASGAAVFGKQCASCHGAGAKGDGAMAAKLKSKPADLTDGEWKHGPSDGEIFTLIRDGAKNAGMKAYRGVLTDRQMWDLVNYIRSIGPTAAALR